MTIITSPDEQQSFIFFVDILMTGIRVFAMGHLHFYSAAALLAMQSAVLATAIPSVRPSVTRWDPIQMHERRITRSSL